MFLVLAMLASPLWSLLSSRRRRVAQSGLPLVTARVVASRIEERRGAFGLRPTWQVEYQRDGQTQRARCDEADSRWTTGNTSSRVSVVTEGVQRRLDRHPVGSTIPVRVDPARPDRVTMAGDDLDTSALRLVLGALAVVAIAFGVLVLLSR